MAKTVASGSGAPFCVSKFVDERFVDFLKIRKIARATTTTQSKAQIHRRERRVVIVGATSRLFFRGLGIYLITKSVTRSWKAAGPAAADDRKEPRTK